MSLIPARLLPNTVVIEKRTTSTNESNEELEDFADAGEIPASVQDRAPTQLNQPDFDGPVIINAVIFTQYTDGLDIVHLDRLRQTDVDPPRRYKVIFANDPAGRHHHFEMQCERMLVAAEVGS